jgi:hypothetical protein
MHQSQDSSPGFEVTYLIKFSFPATMLDSVFLAFGLNMLALYESSIPLRIHARGTLRWHGYMCPAYLASRFFELGQP